MKKFFFIISFVVLFSNNLYSEIINKINIDGNKRISDETIKLFGGIEVNKDYSDNDLNNILKELYNTDFFKKIEIELENNNLNIIVVENPIIQNLIINGVRSNKYNELIRENLVIREKSSFLESKIKKDISMIKNSFKVIGYYFVNIETEIKSNEKNNTVDLIYNIDLGKKAKISKIKFLGNKIYKDRKLRNIITSEEYQFWKFISQNKYLNAERINLDKRLLENFYKNKGYYLVKVNNSYANFLNDESFELIFDIDSGKKFYFNKINLNLPADYKRENFDKVEKILKKLSGKKYSSNDVKKILDEIDKIALQREYQFITAEISETILGDKINFDINVNESEKFYVERINILGNSFTREEVIRNVMLIDEGDPFNEILSNKSINNIKSLNLFKKVTLSSVDGSLKHNKILNIEVEEKPTGEISAGAGVGTTDNQISFGIKEKNYLGRGIALNAGLTLSTEGIKGLLDVSNPNYKNSDNLVFFRVESSNENNLDDFGYETTKYGFKLGTRFEQYDKVFLSPAFSIYQEDLRTTDKASSQLKKQSGESFEITIPYSLIYDDRNQKYRPTDGAKTFFSQTLPLLTDDGSLINTFEHSKYHTFTDEMVGRIGLYLQSVNSVTGKDVRISKRTYLPAGKLRGFVPGKIGPVDGDDFVGGNYAVAINLSTDLPFILPTIESADFKFFLDAANVWGVDYSTSIDDSSKVRSATGISVDWFTPIGPLNFSLASPLTKNSTDKTEGFRFNLGTTF